MRGMATASAPTPGAFPGAAATTGAGPAGRMWWLPVVADVLSIVVGFAALVFPGPTLLVVGVLFGGYLAIWGGLLLVRALTDHAEPTLLRVLQVVLGVLGVLAGVVLLVRPGASVATAVLALGFWWTTLGILQLAAGIAVREQRWSSLAWGALGVFAGVVILAQPGIGVVTLVLIVGISLLLQGTLEIAAGFAWRRLDRELRSAG